MGLNSSQIRYGNCIETSDARVEADAMQMHGFRLLPACGASVFVKFRVEEKSPTAKGLANDKSH